MIGRITGHIIELNDKSALIDTGGLGYLVYVSSETKEVLQEGQPATLWTYLVVKEDALDLYGFLTKKEKDFFELLINVSGIGPKSALGILSLAPPEALRTAILSNNVEYLTGVSGVGRKSAEKIILELKDKLGKLADYETSDLSQTNDTINALKALGYSAKEARDAVQKLPNNITEASEQIKEALKIITK